MREIRLCWSVEGRENFMNEPIKGGLWMPLNDENSIALHIICEEGNNAYGKGTHWIEEREA